MITMSKVTKQKRSRTQKLIIVLIAEFFVFAILTNWGRILEAYEVIKGVDLKFILILPLLQLLSYIWIALYYKTTFGIFNVHLKYWDSYRMTAGLYFVEQILPSGGASGIAYLAYGLKDKASTSLTSLVQLGRYGFNHIAYTIIVLIGVVWSLPLADSKITLFGLAMAALVVVSAGLGFLVVLSGEKQINKVVNYCTKLINSFGRKILRRKKNLVDPSKIVKGLREFHESSALAKNDKKKLIPSFLIMCLSSLSQIAVVYFSFYALGQQTNLSVLIFAFTFANFFGVLSVIPGDVGVHETAMISALTIMGVDFSVAASATLIYRVFNKFIMVAIGFFFYSHFLKPAQQEATQT